jgi:hypothetical protein
MASRQLGCRHATENQLRMASPDSFRQILGLQAAIKASLTAPIVIGSIDVRKFNKRHLAKKSLIARLGRPRAGSRAADTKNCPNGAQGGGRK